MRYYYKDNQGSLFNLKSEDFIKYKEVEETVTLKDENGNDLLDGKGEPFTETITKQIPDGLIDGYTQITEAEYNELAKPKVYEPTAEQKAAQAKQKLIAEKKALLNKYREDVEQVDLFGMEREDYAEKKLACKTLVEELRVLEKNV
nr:MAG TPA: hypothetical protein [Caudoviricetes sp.]